MNSNVIQEAAKFIKKFEGYHKKLPDGSCTAYLDPIGIPTIGWGSIYDVDGTRVKLGRVWSVEVAQSQLEKEIKHFLNGLLLASPILAKQSNSKVIACLSFCFNLGLGAYRSSTFRRKVNECNWQEASEQVKRWDRAGGKVMRGLTLRRKAEANLLLESV
jgi:GH24 family phage-related lysozyme (muramidase)